MRDDSEKVPALLTDYILKGKTAAVTFCDQSGISHMTQVAPKGLDVDTLFNCTLNLGLSSCALAAT